jgi:centromeric protein E
MRMVAETAMNDKSSRSHSIFKLILKRSRGPDFISSKFRLVDLADTERQNKTKAEGIRFQEAQTRVCLL